MAFDKFVCAAVVFILHGCGGGSGGGPDVEPQVNPTTNPTTNPTANPGEESTSTSDGGGSISTSVTTIEPTTIPVTTETTITTTTAYHYCNGKRKVPIVSNKTRVGRLVNELNELFTGFDPNDPTKPVGVTVKMMAFREQAGIECGHTCHGGPNCRVSASVYNSWMPIHPDNTSALSMEGRIFGVVYNQSRVEKEFGKCSYMYDASSWGRVNRGCGCGSKMQGNCDVEDAPFKNQDCKYAPNDPAHWKPLNGTCKTNTESSPNVETCWCHSQHRQADTPTAAEQTTTSQQCYFRGPAMYPPHGSFESELREMALARLANQQFNETLEDGTVRIRSAYWNEVMLDGKLLKRKLRKEQARKSIVAIVYIRGMGGEPEAELVRSDMRERYGKPSIPIIEADTSLDVKCSGIFRLVEKAEVLV